MHTIDSTGTINRLLDLFPAQQQREVRMSFAGALRAIVSQRLVKRADGKGRVPAVEVLVSTGRVYDRIIDPEATIEIRDVIGEGAFHGMQTFDQALVGLVRERPGDRGGCPVRLDEPARLRARAPRDAHPELNRALTVPRPRRGGPLAPSGAGGSRTGSRAAGTPG
jgi:twitching motility protein PilT